MHVNASRAQPAPGLPLYLYCAADTSGAAGTPQRVFWAAPALANVRRGFIPSSWTAVLYIERFADTEWGSTLTFYS